MRLIDADVLMEQIDNLCSDSNDNWIGDDNHSFVLHADVIDIISDAPNIDVAPVVHARWIGNCMCSVCHGSSNGWAVQQGYDFCPHCGAKMDGE